MSGDDRALTPALARRAHGRRLRDDLLADAEIVETHISWVFLRDDAVFKVKKPVDLGFLDFSTLDRREAACRAEVELNRRLAPDVYRGVVPVTADASGRHVLGGVGPARDWAVHMRRLPDAVRADRLLTRGALGLRDVEALAEHLAAFHADARCDEATARQGNLAAIARNVRENFVQTREVIHAHLSPAEAAEVEAFHVRFLREHAERFEARVAGGHVRDGHGDLRLEHVYLEPGGPVIIDCIEFAERFRFADVCADVAFLSMDLEWHGRADLAERFLAAYARASNDFELYRLVDFYESYRAFVRGKVACMLAADEGADRSTRERAARSARRYFLLALAVERRRLVPPAVIAVGGVIAAGKSTIADHLGAEMGAPVVDSDRTRKHMLGVRPTDDVSTGTWTGAYDPRFTEEVYAEFIRRGRAVLASGRPVVLDASFRSRSMRADARALAEAYDVPFYFVECRASRDVCRARLEERARAGPNVSDGRLAVFDDFVARWQDVDELPPAHHVTLDTGLPLEESLRQLKARLPMVPRELTT